MIRSALYSLFILILCFEDAGACLEALSSLNPDKLPRSKSVRVEDVWVEGEGAYFAKATFNTMMNEPSVTGFIREGFNQGQSFLRAMGFKLKWTKCEFLKRSHSTWDT